MWGIQVEKRKYVTFWSLPGLRRRGRSPGWTLSDDFRGPTWIAIRHWVILLP